MWRRTGSALALGFALGLLTIAAKAAEPGAPEKPKPDARFGNWLYKTPDLGVWKREETGGNLTFAVSLPAGDYCTLTLFAGGKAAADFGKQFADAVDLDQKAKGTVKLNADGGPQASKAQEGFDVLTRSMACESAAGRTYHLYVAGHSGDRFDMAAFQATSEEMWKLHGAQAGEFLASLKLANSLDPKVVDQLTGGARAVAKGGGATRSKVGPLSVGDQAEVPFGGNWQPGTVTFAEGLTYFVHWGTEEDHGRFDGFFHLYALRPPGAKGEQTFADLYHEKTPDPSGGPVAIGETVEADVEGWVPCRVVRRLGDQYVIFPESSTVRLRRAEAWVGLDHMRPVGGKQAFGAAPLKRVPPTRPGDIQMGDLVEAYLRGGYGWFQCTVMSIDEGRYYVKAGPDSAIKGWVTLVHMRAVGAKARFQEEDIAQFIGEWNLKGDAFFTTVKSRNKGDRVEKTMELNSGAGQGAGGLKINKDGTYVLTKTAVYQDDVPGKWIRNPDQSEGGIVLLKGERDGKDMVVTPYTNGRVYVQGAIRGPGKIGVRQE